MLEEKVTSVKEFIESYIETYQVCLNTTNSDFIFELVKSSSEMQDIFLFTQINNKRSFKFGINDTEVLKLEEEMKKQLFKQMLCGLNDLDESMETSKQVKIHRDLTSCYFKFIRKSVRDFIPKRIKHKMIKLVLDNFENQLNEHVFTPYVINQSFDEVLKEEEGIVDDRKRIKQLLDAVNKALENMICIHCC